MVQTIKYLTQQINQVLAYLAIMFQPNPYVYFALHFIALLQTLSTIVHNESLLFKCIGWTDPSSYLELTVPLTLGVFFLSLFSMLVALIFWSKREKNGVLVKPSMCLQYILTISIYVLVLLKSVILIPVFRATFLMFQTSQSSGSLALSSITLTLYIAIYPILLFISSNASIFTSKIANKIIKFNSEILIQLFQPFFALASVYTQEGTITLAVLFLLFFLYTTIKTPIISYNFQRLKKTMASMIAMACLSRIFSAIVRSDDGNVLVEIIGLFSFAGLVQVYSTLRLKQILRQNQPSVYQIKLLVFMIGNLEDYFEHLMYFIIQHHKNCNHIQCTCREVMDHLVSKEGLLMSEGVWYGLLAKLCENYFSLKEIKKLGKTEMIAKLTQYSQVVFQVAQIYLFKLNKFNTGWLLLSQYRAYLQTSGLGDKWNYSQELLYKYHSQCKMTQVFKNSSVVNIKANSYLHLQTEITHYIKLLLTTSEKVKGFWIELAKRQPDPILLRQTAEKTHQWNQRIRTVYKSLKSSFPQVSQIVDIITDDYCTLVLNLSSNSPFHVIEKPEFDHPQRKRKTKVQRLDENMHFFSEDSETPVCLVSLDHKDFGKITAYNIFFQRAMESSLGQVALAEDLIIPEMREQHMQTMKNFLQQDKLCLNHKHQFIYSANKKLVAAHCFIQIMPSLEQGLRYAVFLKHFKAGSKLFMTINDQQIAYTSKSFDHYAQSFPLQQILKKCSENSSRLQQQKMEMKGENEQETFMVTCLSRLSLKDKDYKCYELLVSESQQDDIFHDQVLAQQIIDKVQNKKLVNSKRTSSIRKHSRKGTNGHFAKTLPKKQTSELSERTQQKQLQQHKNIVQIFKIFAKKSIGKKTKRFICIINLIAIVLLIVSLAAIIIVKQKQYKQFEKTYENNVNFNKLMLAILKTATKMKQINLDLYQNKDPSLIYQQLKATPSVATKLDIVVSFFDNSQISQIWPSLRLQDNGTFQQISDSYFNIIRDCLQIPLINLQETSLKEFNFSFALGYLQPPLTSAQIFLHNFETNALYFAIPKLRELKQTTMNPILQRTIKNPIELTVLYLVISLIAVITPLMIIYIHRRVAQLNNYTYRLVQSLTPEIIKKKQQQAGQFLQTYSLHFTEIEITQRTTPLLRQDQPFPAQISRNLSRAFDEATDRELHFSAPIRPQSTVERIPSEEIGTNAVVQRRKKEVIFSNESCAWMAVKYLMPSVPFWAFSVAFLILEQQQVKNVRNSLYYQYISNCLGQYLIQVNLYALHFGVYDLALEQFLSIPKYLVNKIYTILYLLNGMISSSTSLVHEDQQISKLSYGNLCQLERQGFFHGFKDSFEGQGDFTRCVEVANSILTKGIIPSFLSYVEGANNLFLANLATFAQGPQAQLNYFNSQFFTEKVPLLNYFEMVQSIFDMQTEELIKGPLTKHYNILYYIIYALIAFLVISLLYFPNYLKKKMEKKMHEVSSMLALISHPTIIENLQLKQRFVRKMDELQLLK